MRVSRPILCALVALATLGVAATVTLGQTGPAPAPTIGPAGFNLPDLTNRQTFSSAIQLLALLTVLSLAPAIIIMMTSFTRIVIVLSLLRQALGTQQLPPNQILIGLSMFMTFLVMGPTFQQVNNDALQPYLERENRTTRGPGSRA